MPGFVADVSEELWNIDDAACEALALIEVRTGILPSLIVGIDRRVCAEEGPVGAGHLAES